MILENLVTLLVDIEMKLVCVLMLETILRLLF